MKRVIELIRVSTEQQAASDRASIPAQRSVNRRTCAQYGLEIVRSIEISDVSGAMVLASPQMQQMIQMMQSPEIHGVVAREFSRLMRPENLSDFALLQIFVETNTVLYLPDGPIDLTNKNGRFMGIIRAGMAGLERTEILERIWTAKEEKRRRGELGQSQVVLPWGVGYESGKGFYYKPEAERLRGVFRQFLAGNHSYMQLARLIDVSPRGMHLIMRNPIWIGWRVIDKKRDTSAAGRYERREGRQADRRKIKRSAEEVIRVKVISDPLISESEFEAVQRIMDNKQAKHWRALPSRGSRFTYRGFLKCSSCGEIVHTALARGDYYACKGRRVSHVCTTKYMGRQKLEAKLDRLFSDRLSSPAFIENCLSELSKRHEGKDSALRIQRLTLEVDRLRDKRVRVIEAFLDGTLRREERDQRLASLDSEIRGAHDMLARETPEARLNVSSIVEAFAPLAEWEYWSPEQKRSVLSAMVPEIRVANYAVESLGLAPSFSNNDTHALADSTTIGRANVIARRR